jgi:hypothetical protein
MDKSRANWAKLDADLKKRKADIQKNPRSRMIVVHLDRLATYQGSARDEVVLRREQI